MAIVSLTPMEMHCYLKSLTVFTLLFSITCSGSANTYSQKAKVSSYLNNQGKGFVENKGQVIDQNNQFVSSVFFQTHLQGVTLYITGNGLSYLFQEIERIPKKEEKSTVLGIGENQLENEKIIHWRRVDMQLKGASIVKENIVKSHPLKQTQSFYLANCPEGITNVRSFQKVKIKNIYPGIDWLLYYENNGQLKYDFILHPGANPKDIQLEYQGGDDFELSMMEKSLSVKTAFGEVIEGELYCYYEESNTPLEASYVKEGNHLTFDIKTSAINRQQAVIIDPPLKLEWATYYGHDLLDGPTTIEVDNADNIYATGYVSSTIFPTLDPGGVAHYQGTLDGTMDMFILKFDRNGVLLWSTYFGGSSLDIGNDLLIDNLENLWIVGQTLSSDFPTVDQGGGAYFDGTKGTSWDATVSMFNAGGLLVHSTYLGGERADYAYDVIQESSGNIVIVGETGSNAFPLMDRGGGAYYQSSLGSIDDAFIMELTNTGQQVWTTYFGGSSDDEIAEVVSKSNGNLYMVGTTFSNDMPLMDFGAGAYFQNSQSGDEAFILQFDANRNYQWGTYYGGSGSDYGYTLDLHSSNDLIVAGAAFSTDLSLLDPGGGAFFQATNGGLTDYFVLRFNELNQMQWGTYIGGTLDEKPFDLTTNATGDIFLVGRTMSDNYPVLSKPGAYFQGVHGGDFDIAINQFKADNTHEWGTFYGSTGHDLASSAHMMLNDSCIMICGEFIDPSAAFTMDAGGGAYYQSAGAGDDDGCFIKLCQTCTDPIISFSGVTSICESESTTITASGGGTYLWETGSTDPSITITPSGTDYYAVEVFDGACSNEDSIQIVVNPLPNLVITTVPSVCFGEEALISATGGTSYLWETGETTAEITVTPLHTSYYSVEATEGACSKLDSIEIVVYPRPLTDIEGDTMICVGESGTLIASGGNDYLWNTGASTAQINISPTSDSYYVVEVTDNFCSIKDSVLVQLIPLPVIAITNDTAVCQGSIATISASGGSAFLWSNGETMASTDVAPTTDSTFYVTVTEDECSNIDSVLVTVLDSTPPTLSIMGENEVCIGDPINLTAISDGNEFLWSTGDVSSSITNSPEQPTTYWVQVKNDCDSTLKSFEVDASDCGCNSENLGVPNAFSPNGDGENDVFRVRGECIQTLLLKVYDRWGTLVFETSSLDNGWDGTFEGKNIGPAVFVYYLTLTTRAGKSISKTGNVTLVR